MSFEANVIVMKGNKHSDRAVLRAAGSWPQFAVENSLRKVRGFATLSRQFLSVRGPNSVREVC